MRAACPCGSGQPYARCCQPRHSGARPAETAQALMRSRYSAYALGLEAYLLATWHPGTRPAGLDLHHDPARWLGLQIIGARAGGPTDTAGEVQFAARYRAAGQQHVLRETSRFVRAADGDWLYLNGQTDPGPVS